MSTHQPLHLSPTVIRYYESLGYTSALKLDEHAPILAVIRRETLTLLNTALADDSLYADAILEAWMRGFRAGVRARIDRWNAGGAHGPLFGYQILRHANPLISPLPPAEVEALERRRMTVAGTLHICRNTKEGTK